MRRYMTSLCFGLVAIGLIVASQSLLRELSGKDTAGERSGERPLGRVPTLAPPPVSHCDEWLQVRDEATRRQVAEYGYAIVWRVERSLAATAPPLSDAQVARIAASFDALCARGPADTLVPLSLGSLLESDPTLADLRPDRRPGE